MIRCNSPSKLDLPQLPIYTEKVKVRCNSPSKPDLLQLEWTLTTDNNVVIVPQNRTFYNQF